MPDLLAPKAQPDLLEPPLRCPDQLGLREIPDLPALKAQPDPRDRKAHKAFKVSKETPAQPGLQAIKA